MALQYNGLGTHDRLSQYSWLPDDDDDGDTGSPSPHVVVPDMATETYTNTATASSAEFTDSYEYTSRKHGPIPHWPVGPYRPTMTNKTPLGELYQTSTVDNTPAVITSTDGPSSTSAATNDEGGPPFASRWTNHGIYAVAGIIPLLVLAMMGGIVFFCLRKRRRQRRVLFSEEMKTPRQPMTQPFMAPPPTTSQHSADPPNHPLPMSSLNVPPPVILGPIPSGSNGVYLTGIDTSDVVSVTSNTNRPVDPFSDNLAEPPPPYRPRSVAPPSFVSASRHSSFRASQPPATSQTRLIEPSPFDDAHEEEDDDISELSGPIGGDDDDNMSAVSDLSYQHDPVVGRTAL